MNNNESKNNHEKRVMTQPARDKGRDSSYSYRDPINHSSRQSSPSYTNPSTSIGHHSFSERYQVKKEQRVSLIEAHNHANRSNGSIVIPNHKYIDTIVQVTSRDDIIEDNDVLSQDKLGLINLYESTINENGRSIVTRLCRVYPKELLAAISL